MKKFIVLLKGVNVGGKNLLPMKTFVSLLESKNYQNVSSYIQSGNIVLQCSADPANDLKDIITEHYGFTPEVFTLNDTELSTAITNNPYSEHKGNLVHFYFCHHDIELNHSQLDKFIAPSEEYYIQGNVFYLYAPNGIGRSKLVTNIESCLGQKATGRNVNTVNKISAIAKSI